MSIEHYFGLKAAPMMAGFIGGVISLSFLQNLTVVGKVLSVFGGAFSAGYFAPIVIVYLDRAHPNLHAENAVAFIIGLVGMNALAGIYKVSLALRKDPTKVVDILKGGRNDNSL